MISSRKTALAVAAMGAIAASTSAVAVNISTNGLGEVGLIPYYTVRDNFQTNISVVNTSNEYVVAFKIRFRDGDVSADIRDFNVFLSPNDVWTANLKQNGTNVLLTTQDNSCVYPMSIMTNGIEFISGDKSLSGHVEIIEMGVANPNRFGHFIAASVVHKKSKPINCQLIHNIYEDLTKPITHRKSNSFVCDQTGELLTAAVTDNGAMALSREFCEPENVLKFSANIVSMDQGFSVDVPVTTLANFLTTDTMFPAKSEDLAYRLPMEPDPSLKDASLNAVLIDEKGAAFNVKFTNDLDPVGAVLAAAEINNEYVTSNGSLTDWIVTYPLKWYYVGGNPEISLKVCYDKTITFFNEEEAAVKIKGDVYPSPYIPAPERCPEVEVYNFSKDTALSKEPSNNFSFADEITKSGFEDGWMRMVFAAPRKIYGAYGRGKTVEIAGEPVIGFAVTKTPTTVVSSDAKTQAEANSTSHSYKLSYTW